MKKIIRRMGLIGLIAFSAGCTSTKIKHDPAKGTWDLDRVTWFQKMEIKSITIGTNTFEIEGYNNDGGSQAAVIVLDATGKIISSTAAKALMP